MSSAVTWLYVIQEPAEDIFAIPTPPSCPVRATAASQGAPPLIPASGSEPRRPDCLGDPGRRPLRDRGVPVIVRFRPVADRVRMWTVRIVDTGLSAPLLVAYVRENLLSWIAKTHEGQIDIRTGFRLRTEAATWILVQGGFAQVLSPLLRAA